MAHVLQFYRTNGPCLPPSVGRYLEEGLTQRDALVVIATPERRARLARQLCGANASNAQLLVLDSYQTLDRFMRNDAPDWELFNGIVGEAIRDQAATGKTLRAFGDMVDVLWATGQYDAAIALERFWNRLRERLDFSLYCIYPLDGLDAAGKRDALVDVHDALLPAPEIA